jgi:hypothetical protein
MPHCMRQSEFASQIQNAIDGANGVQAYERLDAQEFIVVDGGKILYRPYDMCLVKFAKKKDADEFVDSLAKILPSGMPIEVSTRKDGTAQVSFDP